MYSMVIPVIKKSTVSVLSAFVLEKVVCYLCKILKV